MTFVYDEWCCSSRLNLMKDGLGLLMSNDMCDQTSSSGTASHTELHLKFALSRYPPLPSPPPSHLCLCLTLYFLHVIPWLPKFYRKYRQGTALRCQAEGGSSISAFFSLCVLYITPELIIIAQPGYTCIHKAIPFMNQWTHQGDALQTYATKADAVFFILDKKRWWKERMWSRKKKKKNRMPFCMSKLTLPRDPFHSQCSHPGDTAKGAF